MILINKEILVLRVLMLTYLLTYFIPSTRLFRGFRNIQVTILARFSVSFVEIVEDQNTLYRCFRQNFDIDIEILSSTSIIG